MRICIYNVRLLFLDDRMLEFGDELVKINFDVVGISEVWRKGEGCIFLVNSGYNLYYIGGNMCYRGVGFVVYKNIIGYGISFKGVFDRLV